MRFDGLRRRVHSVLCRICSRGKAWLRKKNAENAPVPIQECPEHIGNTRVSLLDLMKIQVGCRDLNGLLFLDASQRAALGEKLDQLLADDTQLKDWNDALAFFTKEPPRETAAAAQKRLVVFLTKQ